MVAPIKKIKIRNKHYWTILCIYSFNRSVSNYASFITCVQILAVYIPSASICTLFIVFALFSITFFVYYSIVYVWSNMNSWLNQFKKTTVKRYENTFLFCFCLFIKLAKQRSGYTIRSLYKSGDSQFLSCTLNFRLTDWKSSKRWEDNVKTILSSAEWRTTEA